MVKRKRPGLCPTQDEKPPEETSTELQREIVESVTPVREVIQLTRTRSQNAPRVLSPCGVQNTVLEDGVQEKQEPKGAPPVQRSSLRVLKRPRKDVSPPATSVSSGTNAVSNKKSNVSKQTGDPGKTRRTWEQWSADDKNSFFEAVCEFGKDFESIQSYIAQRSKKKGVPGHCIKNKDQVRHFYYRTWHKISKVMDIGEGREDVKKQTQELYGLINYAELRKKYSASINEKNGQLLTELVLTGSTMVKIRGKRIRIKTPLCRALKKLNNVEDAKDDLPPKLPSDVYVELRPKNNAAWVHVQSLAQNPRVRTKTSLQRRLSNVLECLQSRWKPLRLRQREQILASLSATCTDGVAAAEPELEAAWELRVWPSMPVSPVSVTATASSLDVSLECHRKKAASDGVKSRKPKQSRSCKSAVPVAAPIKTETVPLSGCASVGNVASNNSPAAELKKPTSAEDEAAKSLTLLRNMLEPEPVPVEPAPPDQASELMPERPNPSPLSPPPVVPSAIESVEDILPEGKEDTERLTLGQLLGLAAEEARMGDEEEEEIKKEEEENKKEEEEVKEEEVNKCERDAQEVRERAKKGWTAREAGLMTIGELYLMMGCPSKIVLQYDFCSTEQIREGDENVTVSRQCTAMLKKLLNLATIMFADKTKQDPTSPPAGRCATAGGSSRIGATGTPPSGKSSSSRALGRSPSSRSVQRPTLQQVQQAQVLENEADGAGVSQSQQHSAALTPDGSTSSGDQHVFVVPMGMAPRTHKQGGGTMLAQGASTAAIAQEQLDKLLPGHRRGQRMRTSRKPLVVQRPLLPRADRRPVTLVRLLPSAPATIATVVQPSPVGEPLPRAVKLLHPGPATFDMQMPVLETSGVGIAVPGSGQTLVPSAPDVASTAVVMAPEPIAAIVVQEAAQVDKTSQEQGTVEVLAEQTLEPGPTLPAVVSSLSPPNISSLLDISLPESLPSDGGGPSPMLADGDTLPSFTEASSSSLSGLVSLNTGPTIEGSDTLPSFAEASDSNLASAFGLACEEVRKAEDCLTASKEGLATPPMSPFKLIPSAPDPNWLNGESSDFTTLSTLLNTLDSPLKNAQGANTSSSGVSILGSENSNLDPITRLAPDVDTQLQCLMNENSVDYVKKFADLAAQIANSNTEGKSS